jgi:hypothetical protein
MNLNVEGRDTNFEVLSILTTPVQRTKQASDLTFEVYTYATLMNRLHYMPPPPRGPVYDVGHVCSKYEVYVYI